MSVSVWVVVLSNLIFWLPSWKAWRLNRFTRAILYFIMSLASAFHHLCLGGVWCIFGSATFARKADFLFAQFLIPVTTLYLIKFTRRWAYIERWLIWSFLVALILVEYQFDEPFWMQLIIVGISLVMLLAYWIGYMCIHAQGKFPTYDWYNLSLGFAFSALACVLFSTVSVWPGGYNWIHAIWHILGGFGQYFILCARDAAPKYAVLDRPIKSAYHEGSRSRRAFDSLRRPLQE